MQARRDLWTLSLSDEDSIWNAPRSMEVTKPKHAVSEGLMALAEDKRPEANLLVGLSQYALQHHRPVIIYVTRVSVGRRLNL